MSSKNDTFRTIISHSGAITHSDYLTNFIGEKPNKYGFYKTDIDLAFQSRSRWKPKDRESFINSCLIHFPLSSHLPFLSPLRESTNLDITPPLLANQVSVELLSL